MAEPLVLVPGLLCTEALWQPQIDALGADCELIIADHRSHDSLGDIAAALLETAPPRFALAGLSMGGYVALEVMRQAPQRVSRLALLDTTARADNDERRDIRRRFIALAEEAGLQEVVGKLLPQFLSAEHLKNPQLVATIREMAAETGFEAFARQQTAIMTRPDSLPDLARIACPTMVLVGAEDALTPPDAAHEMHEAIAGSDLVVVPECGHISTLEQPEAVNEAMRSWLG
ncbi:MAG: alpha/beta hydrolase [Hyphomicrobiales bacterium]|nr:MAG: alpha/beta hydrolase [Hyphomicrobiales bacterium]